MILQRNSKKKIGDILVEFGAITEEDLSKALEEQRGTGKLLGVFLVEKNYVSEDVILKAIQQQMNIDRIVLSELRIPDSVLRLCSDVAFMKRNSCIPFKLKDGVLYLAMSNPLDNRVIDDISIKVGIKVVPCITTSQDIAVAIDKYYGDETMSALLKEFKPEDFVYDSEDSVNEESEDAPMIKLVNSIFEQAVHLRASDIHIEPLEYKVRVRFRVDGDLVEQKTSYPINMLSGIVSRLKIMANLDIAEKRRPQDGRITVKVDGVEFDVRVSVLPSSFGEKIVMRLTNKSRLTMEKSQLGLLPEDEIKFDSLLSNSHGIILVTGPTGSGKSTTLYTALSDLNRTEVNIVTIEDPVEANLDGLTQVQVNEKAGLTFPVALRSFLRQDPDIIMVGEIRDTETANLAVDASLTGHLVVSTLHTNSSISSISRLQKMGIEPYLIADATVGILAQRLVKRLCDCKKPHELTVIEKKKLGISKDEVFNCYEPCGCTKCNGVGYRGRIAVYEILILTDELKEAIADERPISEITDIAMAQGLNTLKMSCVKLIKKGITTIAEMDRIVHDAKVYTEEDTDE